LGLFACTVAGKVVYGRGWAGGRFGRQVSQEGLLVVLGKSYGLESFSVVIFRYHGGFSYSDYSGSRIVSGTSSVTIQRAVSGTGGGLDLAPSNPLGLPSAMGPRSSDSILLTPQLFQGILPQIPNLQVGYLYSFGKTVNSGRLSAVSCYP